MEAEILWCIEKQCITCEYGGVEATAGHLQNRLLEFDPSRYQLALLAIRGETQLTVIAGTPSIQ